MIDITKQITYWRDGALEDWSAGQILLDRSRPRHGLFFIHLAMEKILKAHVCKTTRNVPPRIHNLTRLAELAGLGLDPTYAGVLAEINEFNLEGRYPENLQPLPTPNQLQRDMNKYHEVFQWLTKQL